tara:strand:+ start:244 stop:492 length:249 start_codon:yes stop_codon:yes gene_type:complete
MNNQRRHAIASINKQLFDLLFALEKIEDQEQEAFDNLPDGIASSERGDQMSEGIELLFSAKEQIEEARDSLTQAITTETAIA